MAINTETETVCSVENLSIAIEADRTIQLVENIDLEINKGDYFALVGESGSGKSTLGRAILNLTPIESGRVTFNGQEIAGIHANQMRPLRRDIQMIFQDPMASLNPRKKVKALVGEPMRIFNKYSKLILFISPK